MAHRVLMDLLGLNHIMNVRPQGLTEPPVVLPDVFPDVRLRPAAPEVQGGEGSLADASQASGKAVDQAGGVQDGRGMIDHAVVVACLKRHSILLFQVVFPQQAAPVCAAVRKEDGRLIGYLLCKQIDEPGIYELGWIFRRDVWRRGYAYEAVSALMEHLFRVRVSQRASKSSIVKGRIVRRGVSILMISILFSFQANREAAFEFHRVQSIGRKLAIEGYTAKWSWYNLHASRRGDEYKVEYFPIPVIDVGEWCDVIIELASAILSCGSPTPGRR